MNINVINLEKDNDRRISINKQFKSQNINFNFFNAIDGKKIKRKGLQNLSTSSQIGIFLSHRNIWKNNMEKDYFLICEDDIIIPNNFIKKINSEIQNLKDKNWDIITFNKPINIYPLNKFITACCYVIKGEYAKKLLDLNVNGHVDLKINYNKGNIFYKDIGLKLGNFVSNNTNQKLDNNLSWMLNMPLFNIPFIDFKFTSLHFIIINLLLLYYKNLNYNMIFCLYFIISINIVNC